MTISEFQKQAHQIALEKGWYDSERRFPEFIALMHSELSEALEEYRNGSPLNYRSANGKPEGIAIELADAMIRIVDTAEYLGINIEDAIEDKMAYNRARPYRHGGKLI